MTVGQPFVTDYYDLAADVSKAGFQSFEQRLRDWLALIDDEPAAAAVAQALAPGFDLPTWYQALMARAAAGGGVPIEWSTNRRERLGQTLALFRHFAAKDNEVLQFAVHLYHAGTKLDDNLRAVTRDLFDPMARDLIKEIERAAPAADHAGTVPASDRVVRLDDNHAAAQELRDQLQTVEMAVEQSNELAGDVEGRDQALAELRAGRALLQSMRVRVAAIGETLMPSLRWIGEKAGGTLIGVAVTAVLALIAGLFGLHIPKP